MAPLIKKNAHTISVKVANKPGVLLRIAAVFSRRGYNIDSLVVSPALDGRFARMTITAIGDPKVLDQILKQLNKLIDVIQAAEHIDTENIEREFALIKVQLTEKYRAELIQIIEHFKAETVDFCEHSLALQVSGTTEKLDSCIHMLEKYGILEIVRTGKLLMTRGDQET